MPKDETREERYKRQTRDSFAALGQFVQSFELMVHAARTGCLLLIAKDSAQQSLMNRVLHHHALGAMALFEIWRAVVTATVVELNPNIDPNQRDTTVAVLAQIAKDVDEVVPKRNKLLHATWLIGWAGGGEEDFSRSPAVKLAWSKSGSLTSHVVNTPEELEQLRLACSRIEHMVRSLTGCFIMSDGPRVCENFQKVDGKWITTIVAG